MRTFHYEVTTGDKPNKKGGINNFCKVIIHDAVSAEDAINQAKVKVSRPYYQVTTIYECHDCAKRETEIEYQGLMLKMMQRGIGMK